MNRIIWERIDELKGIKERLLSLSGSSLEPQPLSLELLEVKRRLIELADDWYIEGHSIKGHSELSKIINDFLPNAEKSLAQKEVGAFGTHMSHAINTLSYLIKELEQEFPKQKLGF
ncbi:MAG: hypothetical protein KKH29_01810 [Candidatus Omnitrophica bacterium]|nr:hypothetical protein [Candidatus Omnitrophota bacterium]